VGIGRGRGGREGREERGEGREGSEGTGREAKGRGPPKGWFTPPHVRNPEKYPGPADATATHCLLLQ